MNIFKRLKILYYLHSHLYEKVAKLSDCDLYEPEKNADKLHYQALSAFHMKNYYHARKCYEILSRSNKANYDDFNKLAYIYSRHNEKENAIISWCKSKEKKKNGNIADQALEYVKKQGREINFIEDVYFEEISCKKPFYIPFKKISISLLSLLLIASIIFSIIKFAPAIIERMKKGSKDINKVIIEDYNPQIIVEPKQEEKVYSYSEVEVRKNFDFVKDRIMSNDVNSAIIMLNKLMKSNASPGVKMKLDILRDFIEEPDYYGFKNTISYKDVKTDPALYNDIYILWKGRIVNSVYNKKEKKIGFNLIMGNEDEGIVEGIVPVVFTKGVIAENNTISEVFGIVRNNNGSILIEGLFLIRK